MLIIVDGGVIRLAARNVSPLVIHGVLPAVMDPVQHSWNL